MAQVADPLIDQFYERVGVQVREARLENNLTQAALAARISLTRSSIANLEAGRQRIPLHLIVVIADVLGVEASDLIPSSLLEPTRNEHSSIRERLTEESESTRAFVGGALARLPQGPRIEE